MPPIFLGLKKTRAAIPAADISNAFSRKHALEHGWICCLYLTRQSDLMVGAELRVNENEAVIEANWEKQVCFPVDTDALDVAIKGAPNALNRHAGLGVPAFAAVLFVNARRKVNSQADLDFGQDIRLSMAFLFKLRGGLGRALTHPPRGM